MNTRRYRLLLLLVIVVIILPTAFGPGAPAVDAQTAGTLEQATPPPPRPANLHPNLASNLSSVGQALRDGGETAARDIASVQRISVVGTMVRVEIVSIRPDRSGVGSAVRAAGGRIEAEYADLVQALVPIAALDALASDPSVRTVREARAPEPNVVTGEEVAATGANIWQSGGGNGAGVKVAVIDFGFTNYAAAQAAGELPQGNQLVAVDYCGGNINAAGREHGVATAQIVYEMAPSATIYLLCVNSITQLGNAVTYAYGQGVHIISESASWYNLERGDGTGGAGTPHGIATDARNHGILWSESAGNRQQTHWSGPFNDTDADGFHNYAPNDEGLTVQIPAGYGYCAYLKWDSWPTTSQDFDLYLRRSSDNAFAASSTNIQNGTQTPTEQVCYTNTTGTTQNFNYQIYRISGSGNPRFDLFGHNAPGFEYKTPAGSVTEPATSPNVMAVGAVCWQNSALETFSSLGPTIDGRTKPDIVGHDSVSSAVYGNFSVCGNSGFVGTSASAPVLAGAAALIKQAYPSYGPAEIQSILQWRAVDQGATGFDNSYGYGRALMGALTAPCVEAAGRFCIDARTSSPGRDTGLDIATGQRLIVTGSGRSWYGYEGAAGCVGYPETDPEGNRVLPTGGCSQKIDGNAQLPSAPIGALIARIGSGPWFKVGASYNAIVNTSGRLYLLYNELVWTDDLGIYTANVTVQTPVSCAPRPPVTVQTYVQGGRLAVAITATGAGNAVQNIQFTIDQALVDLPDGRTGLTGTQTYTPPANSPTVTYWIRRQFAGTPATVHMTVNDGCGAWQTFAGAGTGVGI